MIMLGFAAMLIAAPPTGKVAVDRGEESTQFLVDGEVIANYHHGREILRPYFSSLYAPGQLRVTNGSPADHGKSSAHQPQSAWIGHGDVFVEGLATRPSSKDVKGVDFWTDQRGHGVIGCLNVTSTSEPGRAELRSANVWKTSDNRPMVDEERLIELYNLDKGRLLIVTSSLKSAGLPVTFGDTSAGFIGVRVHEQLQSDERKKASKRNKITNSAGKTGESACWGQRADWCDLSGAIDGQTAGVAMFDDPANKPRACWQVRENGLLAANPFGRAEKAGYHISAEPLVRLTVGQPLTLRYGIYFHRGDVNTGDVADAYRKFLALLQ
jgi:hypothetical protein